MCNGPISFQSTYQPLRDQNEFGNAVAVMLAVHGCATVSVIVLNLRIVSALLDQSVQLSCLVSIQIQRNR